MTTSDGRKFCEFCGEPLEPVEVGLFGKPFTIFKGCTCERAVEEARRREAEEEAIRLEAERKAREVKYQFAGIPRGYWEADDPDDASIARKLIARGWRVRFADVEAIEREVRSSWGSRDTNEDQVIDKYVNADLAIIDDLGAEEITPTTMKVLRAVISGREANAAVTIFTSNFSRKEFALHIADESNQVMAQRFASRIAGMTEVIPFDGEDRRLKR